MQYFVHCLRICVQRNAKGFRSCKKVLNWTRISPLCDVFRKYLFQFRARSLWNHKITLHTAAWISQCPTQGNEFFQRAETLSRNVARRDLDRRHFPRKANKVLSRETPRKPRYIFPVVQRGCHIMCPVNLSGIHQPRHSRFCRPCRSGVLKHCCALATCNTYTTRMYTYARTRASREYSISEPISDNDVRDTTVKYIFRYSPEICFHIFYVYLF